MQPDSILRSREEMHDDVERGAIALRHLHHIRPPQLAIHAQGVEENFPNCNRAPNFLLRNYTVVHEPIVTLRNCKLRPGAAHNRQQRQKSQSNCYPAQVLGRGRHACCAHCCKWTRKLVEWKRATLVCKCWVAVVGLRVRFWVLLGIAHSAAREVTIAKKQMQQATTETTEPKLRSHFVANISSISLEGSKGGFLTLLEGQIRHKLIIFGQKMPHVILWMLWPLKANAEIDFVLQVFEFDLEVWVLLKVWELYKKSCLQA